MKKILLSVVALSSYVAVNAQCNELFISEYVEGSGNDKAIEIYNPTNADISLTNYVLARYSNGSTSISDQTTLTGTIAAHSAFVIVNGQTTVQNGGTSPAVSLALQAMADQLDHAYPAPTYMNGNDALTLEKNGVKVDIFGKIGEDPGQSWSDVFPFTDASGAWWTKDQTLQRKAAVMGGVTTNPTTFNPTVEWDSLPNNTWTGLGAHTCDCPTSVEEIANNISVVVFPNPANANYFNVASSETIEAIELYNVMGQRVLVKEGNKTAKQITVETGAVAKGVYTVKVLYANNKITVTRLSVQ